MPPVFAAWPALGYLWIQAGTYITMALASMGMGFLSRIIAGKPKNPLEKSRNIDVRQAISPRRVIYGRAGRLGGVITYMQLTGDLAGKAANQYLHIINTLTSHEVQSIDAIWLDDECITNYEYNLSAHQYYTVNGGKYAPANPLGLGAKNWFVLYLKKTGAAGEDAFPGLRVWPGSGWTSAHQQKGCAAVELVLWWNADKFPNGIPNITVDLHGKKLFDPRTGTTAYSENPALAIRDYLTNKEYGLGCDATEIDDSSVIAAANICDTTVATKTGTEPRYTCNGSFTQDAMPSDVLKGLADSMAGYIVYSQGKWRLVAGAWNAPTVSLGDGDLRDTIKVQSLRSKRDLYNGFKGQFYNPAGKWQQADFPPVSDAFYIAEDSGYANTVNRSHWVTSTAYALNDCVLDAIGTRIFVCIQAHTSGSSTQPGVGASYTTYWAECLEHIWNTQELNFTISPSMCQRIANVRLQTTRNQTRVTLPCKLSAYQLQPGDTFNFTHARFGWTNKTFLVLGADLVIDDKSKDEPTLGVDLQVQEWNSNIFAWDPNTQENTMGTPPEVAMPAWQVPIPPLLAATSTVIVVDNGDFEASATLPPPGWIDNGATLDYERGIEKKGGAQSLKVTTTQQYTGAATLREIAVTEGEQYKITAWFKSDGVSRPAFKMVFHDADGAWISCIQTTDTSSTAWGRYTANGLVPSGAVTAQFSCEDNAPTGASRSCWFDSLTCVRVVALDDEVADGSTNYKPVFGGLPFLHSSLYNGSFEIFPSTQDAADGWTKDFEFSLPGATYARSLDPYQGQTAQAITNTVGGGSSVASRPFPVKGGAKYTLSARVKSSAANPGTCYLRILWYSSDADFTRSGTATMDDVVSNGGPTAADTYQFFSGERQAPATAKYARIGLYNWVGTVCTLTFDSVTFSLTNYYVGTSNQVPLNTTSTYTGPNPLSSSAGSHTINIAAFTIQWGFGTVSYNSGSVTPGSYTTYYIYCDDPTYAGGAVAYQYTTDSRILYQSDGRLYIGSITTSATAPGSGGGGGGGGCPIEGTLVEPLDNMPCTRHLVDACEWWTVRTENGCELTAVPQHQVYTDRGKIAMQDVDLSDYAVTKRGVSRVVFVQPSTRIARKIYTQMPEGHLYWANGILSHNLKPIN
jgi:hypothetical protein